MSEQGTGVPEEMTLPKDFIMVRAVLVRLVGGANEAIVWSRIHYRCGEDSRVAHDTESGRWWAATYDVIAEETGLSAKQARTAIEHLLEGGFLIGEQHRLRSNYDRTWSYQPVVREGQIHLPSGADERALGGDSGLPSGSDVPSIETSETGVETSDVSEGADGWSPEVRRLCALLAELVAANGHRVGKVGEQWWRACDRLMRLDGYDARQVEWVMRWACERSDFWPANIRSMPKLREKFSTLKAQALRDHERRRGASTVEHGRSVDQILAERERAGARELEVAS